ncbi:LysR family transcriptional regulator [Rhodococcus sp. NPDC127528]|uniref:LysR family transcriptional regulator n=1 Tax=unclassified Rhodococcus (in: high G+C Gram-positive bacteria) TaxID=192944 RepID=UPI003640929B
MEFRQAEHFLAVIEHGGVVRAAAALHLAQPSLSQSIRVLERELGTPLFHRVGRGLVPTPAGTDLVKPARQLLRDMATAQASVAELSGLHGGHVDVGSTAGAHESALPDLVGDLRRRYPTVTVRINEYASEPEVVRAVRDGSVELGFGYLELPELDEPSRPTDLEVHDLIVDELVVALPESVAAELADPLPFERLPDLPVIAVPSGARARFVVETALRHASQRTRLGIVTAHRQAAIPLVAAGAGMAWTTRTQADNASEPGVVSRATDPPVLLTMAVLHRPGVLAPAARALLEIALRRRDLADRQ